MRRKSIVCFVMVTMLLCGCSTDVDNTELAKASETESVVKTTDVAKVYENLDKEKEEILKQETGNAEFADNFTLEMPDISEVETFTISGKRADSLELIEERIRDFHKTFAEGEPEEDFDQLLRFTSEQVEYDIDEETAKFPLNLPLVSDYRDQIESGEIQVLWYEFLCEHGYLEISSRGTVHWVNTEKTLGSSDSGSSLSAGSEVTEEIDLTDQSAMSKKIRLGTRETTAGEAVVDCEKFFDESELTGKGSLFQAEVAAVNVMDFSDGVPGLNMTVTPCYHGISFEAQDLGGGLVYGVSESSDGKYYAHLPASVYMKKSTIPEIIVDADDFISSIKDNKTYNKIIAPHDAFLMMQNEVSEYPKMKLLSMKLVYVPYREKEEDEDELVVPAWKLTVDNQTDGCRYGFYVNAINGDFHYMSYSK